MSDKDELLVERVGGLAGFGIPGSRLRSTGTVVLSALSAEDLGKVEALFSGPIQSAQPAPDAFRYRLTKKTGARSRTVEVPEEKVPLAIRNSVKDTLE